MQVLGIIGRDGAMAERLVIPASNLHVVPDHISDQLACY
jgi:NADPH:quinone reductase-like Zn-dependent oxidoreductase